MKYKVIVWGMGILYNKHVNCLKYFENVGEMEILGITGNHLPPSNTVDGYSIIPKEKIKDIPYDLIIVMNERNKQDIFEELMERGVSKEKIVTYKMLELPHVKVEKYLNLKKSNISIISNNCWGGIVYNTLGFECLSPFKNLFLEDDDYLKLLQHLEDYLRVMPEFDRFETDVHSKQKYPVLRADDIHIHCNHDVDPVVAIEKWKRRSERMNYNNVFFEMYTDSVVSAERFIRLTQGKKRMCFVPGGVQAYPKECAKIEGTKELWELVLDTASGKLVRYNLLNLLSGEGEVERIGKG